MLCCKRTDQLDGLRRLDRQLRLSSAVLKPFSRCGRTSNGCWSRQPAGLVADRQGRVHSEFVVVRWEYLINYLMHAAGQSAAAALEADSSAHAAGVCPSSRKAAFSGSRYSAGSRRASSSSRTGSAFRASVFEREKTETAGRVMAEAGAPALARQTVSHELVEAASQSQGR